MIALKEHPLPAPSASVTRAGHPWAPDEVNAHTHVAGKIALVHNGIIENHLEPKRTLAEQGVKFVSDPTPRSSRIDQSRVARRTICWLRFAARSLRCTGAYAVAVIDEKHDRIVVAKNASPLVIGFGDGEISRPPNPAILPYTKRMLPPKGRDRRAHQGRLELWTMAASRRSPAAHHYLERRPGRKGWLQALHAERDPRAAARHRRHPARSHRLAAGDVIEAEMGVSAATAKSIKRVYFIACGTSNHASLYGRFLMESLAKVESTTELASEFIGRDPIIGPDDLVIAVSQSGETLDTLAALKVAKEKGAKLLAIANVIESAIPRAAGAALYTHAGPEIGVASTKCFTTQLAAMVLLAVFIGRRRGRSTRPTRRSSCKPSSRSRTTCAPCSSSTTWCATWLAPSPRRRARSSSPWRELPDGRRGALKLKEISYIHAEGYAAGEMKHGPIALLDADMP